MQIMRFPQAFAVYDIFSNEFKNVRRATYRHQNIPLKYFQLMGRSSYADIPLLPRVFAVYDILSTGFENGRTTAKCENNF